MTHSKHYTKLEVFATSIDNMEGKVTVKSQDGSRMEQTVGKGYYRRLRFDLEMHTDYEIFLTGAKASCAYLCGNENLLEEGVCYLSVESGFENMDEEKIAAHYDTCYREQYHFAPFANWMNDPNGVCWFHGKYHMFYQANPHSQEWNNMYWGHAVSEDLVHWKHLPIVLEPQEMILDHPETYMGGAYSGSAVVFEDEVLFYLTRHLEEKTGEKKVIETQSLTRSRDLLTFEPEKTVISQKPKGSSADFRDPKLLKIEDTWYMVLGSALNGKAAILLYRSEDMEHWEYDQPLLVEEEEEIRCFECPDFYQLDGVYVAVGAWMEHHDAYGRYQMSRYYIGDWKAGKYEIKKSGWFDFGSNCYAMQTFEHEGQRICFGWVCDFYQEHMKIKQGAYGSLTIPRKMHVKNHRLYMEPVSEIYKLQDRVICRESRKEVSILDIYGNSYLAKIELTGDSDFSILLGKDGRKSISLVRENGIVKICTPVIETQNIVNGMINADERVHEFPAETKSVRYMEIFVDRRVVEVYLNHGEETGTRLFYNSSKNGIFQLKAVCPEEFSRIEIITMKSIW